ncbi:MAG TPA: hypothetical protein VIJ12_09430 [Candidatus Baltobacteraceae bacterium]
MISTIPARASTLCATPGHDGVGSPNGIVDTYFAPASSNVIIGAGSNSISLGAHAFGDANVAIAAGDLVLIVQMQDATISTSNSIAYGDGATGTGETSQGTTGTYEYVVATDAVSTAGGTLTFEGTGANNGTNNTYTEATATSSLGQETFQVIRVPQYTTATLGSGFTAFAWNGAAGGIAAIDVMGSINLNSATASIVGKGFRGGGVHVGSGGAGLLNTDYATSSSLAANGSKGEGPAGTPHYAFDGTSLTTTSTDYPGGSMARGAPSTAGGGATDNDPTANDENSGGGGGANAGSGGMGGKNFKGPDKVINAAVGGLGGTGLGTAQATVVTMGGGGAAGSSNLGTDSPNGSSGGSGGGIFFLRVGGTTGSGTFDASGGNGQNANTDGGGGAGGAGTIVITSPVAISGITANANGGTGGSTSPSLSGNANRYGPGGGGGGGWVMTSTAPDTRSMLGGSQGTTISGGSTYGAASGKAGSFLRVDPTTIPGVLSGAECPAAGSGGNEVFLGPNDPSDATFAGAAYTGSYDGIVLANNNNDFTAAAIPLGGMQTIQGATIPGTTIGNALTLSTGAQIDIPSELYDDQTGATRRAVTVTATAPSGWTALICRDDGTGIACGTFDHPHPGCGQDTFLGWTDTLPTAGATSTGLYCVPATNGVYEAKFWVRYTSPTALTAFSRYDASIVAQDNQTSPAANTTHDELYAGYVALTKAASVLTTGCPPGVNPPVATGVCPGGVVVYTIDYRNIMVGGGTGTQAADASNLYLVTPPGSFAVTDDGSANGNNWSANSNGLTVGLTAASSFPNCGVLTPLPGACGDTTTGSIFTYDGAHPSGTGATMLVDQVGGATFQLYPAGVSGKPSQGTLEFAIQIK